jgi:coproporphyrinogen III oxidase-like Fe-S oxidoreductase
VALGLRRVDGFSRAVFAAEFGEDPLERFSAAVADSTASGLLQVDGDTIRLTPGGRLLASEAMLGFLPSPAGATPAGV